MRVKTGVTFKKNEFCTLLFMRCSFAEKGADYAF